MKTQASVLLKALSGGVLVLLCGVTQAAGQFIEDVQVERRGDEATITLELACPMRFQSDVATQQGMLLEIRVAPLESCRQLGFGDDISSELYRPLSGRLAYLTEIEFESLGLGEHLVLLRFDRPVAYRVAQRGDLRSLQLIVRLDEAPPVTNAPVLPAAPPPAPTSPAQSPPAAPSRAPLTMRVREPSIVADYIINLQSTREPIEADLLSGLTLPSGVKPYVSETELDGQHWYRLRLGFFASEEAAREVLDRLGAPFPRAWTGRAEPEEVRLASSFEFTAGSSVALPGVEEAATVAAEPGAAGTLGAERVAELLEQGRAALLGGDNEAAIRIYSRLVEEPGEHQADAREYLGLARERNGQIAAARAEYRAYLAQYPGSEGARRVQQRLNGLVVASQAPREPLRKATDVQASRWDFGAGWSQYYRRDVNQFDTDEPEILTLSAVLTDLDLNVSRTGGPVDLQGRLTVSNLYDLDKESTGGLSNSTRVSYAYFDVDNADNVWGLRLGRQRLRSRGVLGRFDGAHFSYEWAPERRVHVMTGFPVESTRFDPDTSRQFYGVAVDFDHLIGAWDLSTFINNQTIEGYTDRQAAGLEMRYLDDKRSLTTMLDYDYHYDTFNTVLALGTWRFDNRLTLTGLLDRRMSPALTTRNALIGQPLTTIEDLLLVLTEEEVQQLAVDRTAETTTVTLGMAKPLFQRFQMNADITATEIGGTAESFGVPAIPDTGQQTYYSLSFVGSSLFGEHDVTIFSARHGVGLDFTTSQVSWDTRFAIGRKLRINPRLRLAVWDRLDGRHRETVNPSLRLLLNMRNHYRLEIEVGSDELQRTTSTTEQDSSGTYLNVGYRADF